MPALLRISADSVILASLSCGPCHSDTRMCLGIIDNVRHHRYVNERQTRVQTRVTESRFSVTESNNPYQTAPIPPQVTPQTPTQTATPPPTVPPTPAKKSGSGGKIARRALLAGVGVGACVAGVELAPTALKKMGEFTQAEVQDAFSAGVESGRKAILDELSQIEGLTIDGAIGAAELTRLAVKFIVLPVSRLMSTIEGGALDVLYNALQSAKDNLAKINVHISQLDGMKQMVSEWRDGINQLPTALGNYANADINSAESYLKALQKKIQQEKQPSL